MALHIPAREPLALPGSPPAMRRSSNVRTASRIDFVSVRPADIHTSHSRSFTIVRNVGRAAIETGIGNQKASSRVRPAARR